MTRTSKQAERRNRSPRRTRNPAAKTGPRKDNLPKGYREHPNALPAGAQVFIPKIS